MQGQTWPCWVQEGPQEAFGSEESRHENWILFAWPTEINFLENLMVVGRQGGRVRVPKRSKVGLQLENVQKAPSITDSTIL